MRKSPMRLLVPLALLSLLPFLAGAAPAVDKKKVVQPIQVVTLPRTTPVSYDKDVEPILVNKCAFCHSGNVTQGNLDMVSYESLMKGGKRGKPVVAGGGAERPR